jgi:hypothetical protein
MQRFGNWTRIQIDAIKNKFWLNPDRANYKRGAVIVRVGLKKENCPVRNKRVEQTGLCIFEEISFSLFLGPLAPLAR